VAHTIILLKIINFTLLFTNNNEKDCIFTQNKTLSTLKKTALCILFASFIITTKAQYFYKDIVSNQQVSADMKAYKENKIRKVTLKSFEDNGIESEGFFCEKKISKNYKKSELFTRADIAPASLFTSTFDDNGKLLSTNDSSSFSVTEIRYSYDDKQRISSIVSTVRAIEEFENSITEEHLYRYENNILKKMVRVKNGKDSTDILFTTDENGNITLEKDTKNGTKFYYYYDTQNRLTDIVQANEFIKNLKPDYIFEYNSAGQITQMTAVEEGSSNYFIWKYNYENGLRLRERCFTNEKRLMGRIEYEYK
jgi:hypothetical protein